MFPCTEASETSVRWWRWRRRWQRQPGHQERSVPRQAGPRQEGGEVLPWFGKRGRWRRRHVWLDSHRDPFRLFGRFLLCSFRLLYIFPFYFFINGGVQRLLMCRCFTLFINIHIQVCFFYAHWNVLYLSEAAFRNLERCSLAHFNC